MNFNKKFVIGGVVVIILVVGILLAVNIISPLQTNPPMFLAGSLVTERGTILERVIPIKASGDNLGNYFRVRKEGGILSGEEFEVMYYNSRQQCHITLDDITGIQEGNVVEVHGIVVSEKRISLCGSNDYYIRSASEVSPQQVKDPIENLVTKLSSNPLWQNGISPVIDLPPTASSQQVVQRVFEMISFDQGKVSNHSIVEIREVQIRGSLPDQYTAVLVKTNLGEKIILLQYSGKMWWSKVYDQNYYQYQSE